jgi:hypothetical protein
VAGRGASLCDLVPGYRDGFSGAGCRHEDVAKETAAHRTSSGGILFARIDPGRVRFKLHYIDNHWNAGWNLSHYSGCHLGHGIKAYSCDLGSAISGIGKNTAPPNQFRSLKVTDVIPPLAFGRITNVRFWPAVKLNDPLLMYCTTGNPAGVTIMSYDPAPRD